MALFRRRRRDGREPVEERDDAFDGPANPHDDLRDKDDEDEFVEDDPEADAPGRGGWRGTLSRGIGAGIVAAVVVVGLYYVYTWGVGQRERPLHRSELPVVAAEEGPEKVRPEDPGGMEVRHQDKLVLNEGGAPEGEPKVERLLPPPEDPQPLPEAERAAEDATEAGESEASATMGETGAAAVSEDAAPASSAVADAAGASESAREVEMPDAPAAPSEQPEPGVGDGDEGGREPAPAASGEGAAPAEPTAGHEDTGAEAPAADEPSENAQPAPPQPRPGDALVQLAAFRDKATAERVWGQLRTRFPNILGDQRLLLQDVEIEGKGTFWRVRTGPFPNRATARDVCAQLKARDQACLVVTR